LRERAQGSGNSRSKPVLIEGSTWQLDVRSNVVITSNRPRRLGICPGRHYTSLRTPTAAAQSLTHLAILGRFWHYGA
jgi:hypothetical protein